MPDQPGFTLNRIEERSIVRLRVHPRNASRAAEALNLPQQPMRFVQDDPAIFWLSPDQWLLSSDTRSAGEILEDIDGKLSGSLYAATDMSSGSACFSLSGPTARAALAMGCGIDTHSSAFTPGMCVNTHFANVLVFIVAVAEDEFDLYIDRSHRIYIRDWFVYSGTDPMTRRESSDTHIEPT